VAKGGGRLHVVRSGAGPTVVLVHGVAGSHRIFDPIVPLLEPEWTVVRVDLLGYGHSPRPRTSYSPEVHTTAIREALLAEEIPGPFTLVGLSMGVDLVLEYAARWPDEVADVIGIGFPYYPDEASARAGIKANPFTKLTVEHRFLAALLIPLVWLIGRNISPLARKMATIYTPEMAKDTMRCRYLAFRRSLFNTMIHNRPDGVLAASGERRRLFVHGGADRWCSPARIKEVLAPYPDSHLEVIDGAAHNLVVLEPVRTVELIGAHLADASATDR
jgi:pimeloyl-ACP methyl ester carboxylesterase